jgi:hypothetical protein
MKFREHRGGLDESMKDIYEFSSIAELKQHVENWFKVPVLDICIKYYCYDERIAWDTYLVSIKLEGEKDFWAIGYADSNF